MDAPPLPHLQKRMVAWWFTKKKLKLRLKRKKVKGRLNLGFYETKRKVTEREVKLFSCLLFQDNGKCIKYCFIEAWEYPFILSWMKLIEVLLATWQKNWGDFHFTHLSNSSSFLDSRSFSLDKTWALKEQSLISTMSNAWVADENGVCICAHCLPFAV